MKTLKKTGYIAAGMAFLVIVWQIVVATGRYDEALLPSPLSVLWAMEDLLRSGKLFEHFGVSLGRFVAGYVTASLIAIALGLVLGRIRWLWNVIDPIVQLLRPVSPIAWSPFIVLWFGIGNAPAITIIFLAAFFPVLLSTVSAVRKVNPVYLKVASNIELGRLELLRKIIFPAAFPTISNGLHIAIGTSWIFLVSGEMVGSQSGLGFLIVDSRNFLRLDFVLAGIIFIGLCGLLLDQCVRLLERRMERKWGIINKE
jgi:NitT/TauT family transport system permease protein